MRLSGGCKSIKDGIKKEPDIERQQGGRGKSYSVSFANRAFFFAKFLVMPSHGLASTLAPEDMLV